MLTDHLEEGAEAKEEETHEAAKIQVSRSNVLDWKFDVIKLEMTEKHPLVWLGMKIFAAFDACKLLKIDESTLRNWLGLIEDHYRSDNAYHNATHAADVLQATACYLKSPTLENFLEPLDKVACLIAAVIHDTDHPGKTNAFLINSNDPLALLYNDIAVLESHHAALAFKLTLKDSKANIFRNLDPITYRSMRTSIVDMVLATDMTQHKLHVTNFRDAWKNFTNQVKSVSSAVDANKRTDVNAINSESFRTPENVEYVKRMLIKCADVSNPARPLKLAVKWAERISEEFFRQNEDETARKLPITMPMYNRSSCSLPATQIGFYDYFITELYSIWHDFTKLSEPMKHYRLNYDFWKDLAGRKINSLTEVKRNLSRGSIPILKEG